MSVPEGNRRGRVRSVLATLVTLAMLVPVGLLFLQLRRAGDDDISRTRIERQAVAYLAALTPLLSAVTEAQSTALRGRTGALPAVEAAVAEVAQVDKLHGTALGVHERWSTLADKVGRLPAAGDPTAVLQSHVEATDLLLALYDAIRDNAALSRDPDADVSRMQQAAAVDLPRTVIFATRSADLAPLVAATTGDVQQQLRAGLAAASAGAAASVADATENLQTASDDTASASLSSNILGTLDKFRRAIEAITLNTGDGGRGPNQAQLANAYSDLQQGLSALASTVLAETDKLLVARIDDRQAAQRTQLIVAGAAVLGAVLLLTLLFARRRRPTAAEPATQERPDARRADSGPPGGAAGIPRGRERSGALR
jgi:hypothetical protein